MKDQINQAIPQPDGEMRDPPPVLTLVTLDGVRPPVKLALKRYMITDEDERSD